MNDLHTDLMSQQITDEILREEKEALAEARQAARRKRHNQWFIPGPFRFEQWRLAKRQGGEALAVWQLIHFQVRRAKKRRVWVTLPTELLREAEIGRATKDRAVLALERAGLVRVERQPGHATRIALEVETG